METIEYGGRAAVGFGLGSPLPQVAYVRPAEVPSLGGKVGAFVGGALTAAVAAAAATALVGEGGGYVDRLRRGWPVVAASLATGGVVGAVIA